MIVTTMQVGQRRSVETLLRDCGREFSNEEIDVALGMLDAALSSGGYCVLSAVDDGRLAGYCLAAPTSFTESTWDLCWLCVHPDFRRRGVATALQLALEQWVRAAQGKRIVVETACRPEYDPARAFYGSAGYDECGRIPDYYGPGDACAFLCKLVPSPPFGEKTDVP